MYLAFGIGIIYFYFIVFIVIVGACLQCVNAVFMLIP